MRDAGVVICLGALIACGSAKEWTPEEIANVEQIFVALQADRRAAEIENLGEPGPDNRDEAAAAAEHRERALRVARSVRTEVLAKAHPDLPEHFRDEFQRALELFVDAYRKGDDDMAREATRLRARFGDWYVAHRHEIHIPGV